MHKKRRYRPLVGRMHAPRKARHEDERREDGRRGNERRENQLRFGMKAPAALLTTPQFGEHDGPPQRAKDDE